MKNSACLLIDCPDKKGLVAAIADFLLANNSNILHADQHQDADLGMFFMRVEFDLDGMTLPFDHFKKVFDPIAKKFQMGWTLKRTQERPKIAIFVSRQTHCLIDLLYRRQVGELNCDIPLIISNHAEAEGLAKFYGIPFHLIPVTPQNKKSAEKQQLALLDEAGVNLIVLARYMQVLSSEFVNHFPNRLINVHHSFLPAFAGAKPYHQAYERGVKLIGATSHYVTDVLDDGPIIEQDVARISHRDQVADLTTKGRDLEKVVLSRGVRWHLENRILVYGKKTVVFD